jgi:hypothetical protein
MTKKDDKQIIDLNTDNKEIRIIGADCGTMNLCCATRSSSGDVETKLLRNVFLPIEANQLAASELNNLDHVADDDMVYIIGEDAYRLANIFGHKVRRPMSQGLISSEDIDALDVLSLMMQKLVGKTKNGYCVYSVPAPSVDKQNDITYHKGVFKRIFTELGYTCLEFNEAASIIYSECQNDNFTGLSFSFGAGMGNIALCYKSTTVLSFSVARGGDWIDESVARSLAVVPNRVTSIKENNTDLINYMQGDKKERRIREAIAYYYKEMINYTLDNIRIKISKELSNVELPDALPIVISGGTSKAKGFLQLFTDIIDGYKKDLPFEIKEIRMASDPMTAVAEGCLIKAMSEKGI